MWIIPKNYPLYSLFVQDMVASKEDLTLQGLSIEQSLMWRSKPSQLRTWLQRWKRMPWFQRLCSRILKPSQHTCFEEKLTLLLADIPANHSVQQGNEKAKTTPDTYGPISENTSKQLDLIGACLKTSRDISALDSEKSLATWKALVTKRRGEYSARKKSAHLIDGSGCLFWPTPTLNGNNNYKGASATSGDGLATAVKKWPTVRVSSANGASQKEIEQGNPKRRLETEVQLQKWPTPRASDSAGGDRTLNKKGQRISKSDPSKTYGANLSDKVKWATPNTLDYINVVRKPEERSEKAKKGGCSNLREQVHWATPNTMDYLPPKSEKATLRQATSVRKGRSRPSNLREQVDPVSVAIYEQQNWPTVTVQDSNKATKKMRDNHQNNLTAVVFDEEKLSLPTPTSRDYKGGYKEESLTRANGKSRRFDALPNAAIGGVGTDIVKGHLNPDWVEQLMGLPPGWTALDGTSNEWQYGWHDGSWEQDIPRVVESCEDRVDRIRLLGNGVVPLTACRAWQVLTA